MYDKHQAKCQEVCNFLFGAALSSFASGSHVLSTEIINSLVDELRRFPRLNKAGAQQVHHALIYFDMPTPEHVAQYLPGPSKVIANELRSRVASLMPQLCEEEYFVESTRTTSHIGLVEERIAIMHFDGRVSEADAERLAKQEIRALVRGGWPV